MRLLRLMVHEPVTGNQILPLLADRHGEEEALRRYRAVVLTTLRQLKGLQQTRIQIHCTPADADEALRFWLLPRLADTWQASADAFHADGWLIGFGELTESDFDVIADGDVLCPWMGARWVHAAMIGIGHATHRVIGHSHQNQTYLEIQSTRATATPEVRTLPPLTIIHDETHWQEALESPLGAALKKALEEESG